MFPKKWFHVNTLILALTCGLLIHNIISLYISVMAHVASGYSTYYEPGYQFLTFKPKLAGIERVGYLTSKDMSREKNDGIFLQAQYFLAPTILELNRPNPVFNIVDFPDYTILPMVLRKINARPVAHNDYGQALTQRKR